MHTKELGVVSTNNGKVVVISEKACRDIAERLSTTAEALIDEHDAVVVDFHGPVNLGVDAAEAIYKNGLVCPVATIGLADGFLRFRNNNEPSFVEYSTGHRLYTVGLSPSDPRHHRICVEYADRMLGRVTRVNEELDTALGVSEPRGVYGEIL